MASKHDSLVLLHQRAEVEPMGKDKPVAGEGKSRRALTNIDNIPVADGSFAAQFGYQHKVSDASNKLAAEVAMKAGRKGSEKTVKKTVATKSKPELSNEISPDKVESLEIDASKASNGSLSRRKVSTLTSVLITRSKESCGVHDIDACDAENQLALVDYVEDLYKFYKLAEKSSQPRDYMVSQDEINADMRAIIADWLIQVHDKFQLMPETLYLTFHIMDRYLSIKSVQRKKLQLVGISSMLIACKYEETWAPHVDELVYISGMAYSREKILKMEKGILNKLEWTLTVPTMYVFLLRFVKAALADKAMEQMVFFFSELALMHYSMIIYSPSVIAASAVYAACCTLKKRPLWTKTLEYHTGFKAHELVDCAAQLVSFHSSAAASTKRKAVYKKYSGLEYEGVALHPPALKILESLRNALVRLFGKVVRID